MRCTHPTIEKNRWRSSRTASIQYSRFTPTRSNVRRVRSGSSGASQDTHTSALQLAGDIGPVSAGRGGRSTVPVKVAAGC